MMTDGGGTRLEPADFPDRIVKGGRSNVSTPERWISMVAGLSFARWALKARTTRSRLALGAAGLALLDRGVTGSCPIYTALGVDTSRAQNGSARQGMAVVERVVTLSMPPEETYNRFRRFEDFPTFMQHVRKISYVDHRTSQWSVRMPWGADVQWRAELIEDIPGEIIRWRTIAPSDVEHEGEVRFVQAPGGRGTELYVRFAWSPPGGRTGELIAEALGQGPDRQLKHDLRSFKQFAEAHDVSTNLMRPPSPEPTMEAT